jgi:hypothetical protein
MKVHMRRLALLTVLALVVGACALTAPPPGGGTAAPTPSTSLPGPAPTGTGEIRADCDFSHRAPDDPIVHFGHPGAAHSHDFFGPDVIGATTTATDLTTTPTTCDPNVDRSAYWFPTLSVDGVVVDPERSTFYYTAQQADPRVVQPYPFGLKVLAGDPNRTGPTGTPVYKWSCLGDPTSSTGAVPLCPTGHDLELLLHFPDCWNGTDTDTPDHRSHMAYSTAEHCPTSHPIPVPELQFKLRWPTRGGPGTTLASGNGYSAHADFMNAWDETALAARIRDCLHAGRKCGNDGVPVP